MEQEPYFSFRANAEERTGPEPPDSVIIPTTGLNNCGGRCRLLARVRDGRILRITGDPDYPDLMPCIKCVRGPETFLGPDRLTTPLKRAGGRGEGKFVPISWQEAVEEIAEQWVRIRDTYGPASRYVNYGWGVSACLSGTQLAKRLLRLDGGHLDYYNSYSTACCACTTPYLYGTDESGSTYDTLLDSRLILLWGHNPAETRFDNLMYWLRRARDRGIPMVVIDPRRNATVKALGAEWIPLNPSTDSALMDAMAYVIWSEDLYDHPFVEDHCQGFTRASMPKGAEPARCYFDYLAGTLDGTPKTPAWAEPITGVAAEEIIRLARRFAAAKPAALLQGYGGQRHANGEQFTRGGIMLACLTGNVGVSGGWGAGSGYCHTVEAPKLPSLPNPVKAEIPCYGWTSALAGPEHITPKEGLRGAEKLDCGIKMLLNLAGDALINQHGDINRTRELLADETKCEFILCSDLFLTPSAAFADILLPGISMFEGDNLTSPWDQGNFIGFCNQLVEPVGESRFEFDWLAQVARRLGLERAFTGGHADYRGLLRACYEETRRRNPELPDYDTLKKTGIYRFPNRDHVVGFADRRFPTPSGRVEIYSPALAALNHPRIPAIPGYVPAPEGPEEASPYPLQLIAWHPINRCHSVHDNNRAIQAQFPQQLWMNPEDSQLRGLADGDLAEVWNARGRMAVPVRVTEDIQPGTVALAQGAWYSPDGNGIDRRGSVNVLTSWEMTPLAHGNGQHTNRVEVRPSPEQPVQHHQKPEAGQPQCPQHQGVHQIDPQMDAQQLSQGREQGQQPGAQGTPGGQAEKGL